MFSADLGEPVVLTAEDLPTGVTVDFGSTSLTSESSYSLIDVKVRGAAAAGAFSVKIRGTTASHGSAVLEIARTIKSLPGHAFADVAVGYDVACGLDAAGLAYCWGKNADGELGIGTSGRTGDYKRNKPTPVVGGLTFKQIAPAWGNGVSCGLTTAGKAYCWGNGYLGDGTFRTDPSPPVAVSGDLTFEEVTAGMARCGRTAAGEVYCWAGANGYLGVGTNSQAALTPVKISGALVFRSLVTGGELTCGVTDAGTAYCWGNNAYGEGGTGTTAALLSPTAVATSLKWKAISPGDQTTCGLTVEGAAYCWGANGGNLGFETQDPSRPTLTAVSGGASFATLSTGVGSCALDAAGAAHCWGYAAAEGNDTVWTPTPLLGALTFTKVSTGRKISCGLATNGLRATYCWAHGGTNSDGYLGTGDNQDYKGPVPIAAP